MSFCTSLLHPQFYLSTGMPGLQCVSPYRAFSHGFWSSNPGQQVRVATRAIPLVPDFHCQLAEWNETGWPCICPRFLICNVGLLQAVEATDGWNLMSQCCPMHCGTSLMGAGRVNDGRTAQGCTQSLALLLHKCVSSFLALLARHITAVTNAGEAV